MAIIFIVSLLRSVFRLLMPILVIGLVMVVFLGFTPSDVINKGKYFIIEGTSLLLENILPFLDDDVSDNGTPPEHDPLEVEKVYRIMKKRIQIFLGSRKMRI